MSTTDLDKSKARSGVEPTALTPARPTFAARREALVALCAHQRGQFTVHYHELTAPSTASTWTERIRALLSGRLQLPLAIASAVVGIASLRRGGPVSLAAKALGLWKVVGPALAMLRRPAP